MDLHENSDVTEEQFHAYLNKKDEAFKLFDFLDGDVENNRNLIKLQHTY